MCPSLEQEDDSLELTYDPDRNDCNDTERYQVVAPCKNNCRGGMHLHISLSRLNMNMIKTRYLVNIKHSVLNFSGLQCGGRGSCPSSYSSPGSH